MTFFVDANVIVYGAVPSEYREPCLGILESIARGEADGRTSTAVLEEVWFIELSGRAGRLEGLTERTYTLFTPLLSVADDAFRFALSLDSPHVGTNDRLHVGTCMAHGIEQLVSADAGFEDVGGIRRIDPLDGPAVHQLIGGSRS